ncbi:MAG: membrane protein insertase YidC [Colwelliaceae bacterium]|nr:membrane protein insertase YidC [Colwelliaceae bacterium]
MDIWTQLLNFINESIIQLSNNFNGDQALAIIAFTIVFKLILMPLQLTSSLKMAANKSAMEKLKPELELLKSKYKNDPKTLFLHSSKLYNKHNIKFIDKASIANMATQGVFGFAMFQSIKELALSTPFLWISNLAKPDVALALVVGFFTYLATIVTPGMAEQSNQLIILMPAILSILVVATFPSALGLYWATSNIVTIFQSFIVKGVLKRQTHSLS